MQVAPHFVHVVSHLWTKAENAALLEGRIWVQYAIALGCSCWERWANAQHEGDRIVSAVIRWGARSYAE